MQLFRSQSNLGVVGTRRGEKLDASFCHRMCSRNNILRVQPDVLDPWRPVLLQEGVHLIPAWNEHNSDTGVVLSSNVAELNHLFKDGSGCCWSPCSGRDSAMTNLQSGSFLSTKGRAMPASLHFQYSMAVSRRPMPSWFMTKPSFTSSLLLRKQQSSLTMRSS